MEVFISVDMEGVAGVAHRQQVTRGSDEYPAARALMAGEANAAIAGACDGGATRVVVNDSHGDMRNLEADELDERAELLTGSPKIPYGMVQGISATQGAALFIGYHARTGTQAATLDHAFAGGVIHDIRVNGDCWGEIELNATLAGSFGVPVALVTGDDKACAQAAERLPQARRVVVKHALGRQNVLGLHPAQARARIREAAAEAVSACCRAGVEPFRPAPPFAMEVDVANTGMADVAELLPGAVRLGPRTIQFTASTADELIRARMAITTLATTALP
jgi:D-amino peptidase